MKAQLPCGRKRVPIDHSPSATPSTKPSLDWRTILNQFLLSKKLRNTGQREKIAEIALTQDSHFEIQTLIKRVQETHPEISPATVYRSVSTLCEAGLLSETLQSSTGVTLYEAHDHSHHDHIVCLDCGEIFEYHDESLEEAQNNVAKKMSFTQIRHQHVIYANCNLIKKK